MKYLLALSFTLMFFFPDLRAQPFPQNPNQTDPAGLRQGKWTILYDVDWNLVSDPSQMEYYRVITYRDDKPVGKVYDYYKNGQVQWEGQLLADRPQEIMDGKVIWYDELGNKSTVQIFEQGKLMKEQQFNPDGTEKPYSWRALNQAGMQAYQEVDYSRATEIFIKAKSQAEKEFGKDHPSYALSLNNLAYLYQAQGNYAAAAPLYQQALKIREITLGESHSDYAQSLNNLAYLYQALGDYAAAAPLYQQALEITKTTLGESHPNYASSLNNLAVLYKAQGNYVAAAPLYQRALEIRKTVRGESHPDYAQALNNLAGLFYSMGDYAAAAPLYQKALEIRKATLGENHPSYAGSLGNLAELYRSQGDYAAAAPLYQQALEIRKTALGESHPDYANSLSNLAFLYETQGDYAAAVPLYQQALEIRKTVLGENHPDYAGSLNSLAILSEKQGDYAAAVSLYQQALEIRKITLGESHPNYAQSLNNLAGLYYSQGDYAAAAPLFRLASQVVIGQTESNFSNLSEKEKGNYFKTFSYLFEIYNSFALIAQAQNPSLRAWIYDNALVTKGLLLQSSQKIRQIIQASGNDSLQQSFETWLAQRDFLARLYQLPLAEREKSGLEQVEAEVQALEKELSRRSAELPGYLELFGEKKRYSWIDVRQKLSAGEAAIEIIRSRYYDQKLTDSVLYIALIIRPETRDQPEMVVLPNGCELEGKYRAYYQNTIRKNGTDKFGYAQYWQPIAEKLSGIRKVYFSGDGVYHQINLNTLRNPETGAYPLDELEIHLLVSTKDLVQKRPEVNYVQGESILMGYPDYELSSTEHKNRIAQGAIAQRGDDSEAEFYTTGEYLSDVTFPVLAGTKTETESIFALMQAKGQKVALYLGENALEEVIKSARSPKVLHIATHGVFFESQDLKKPKKRLGTRQISDGDIHLDVAAMNSPSLSPEELKAAKENPLMRSGLVLTGVTTYARSPEKYTAEDGYLSAYEAQNLFLDNTELVVLSACETAKGDLQYGEGIYGLQRGFQKAGAKSVLMSLWKVDDTATQELMSTFYTQWLSKGKSKRAAFRKAQQQLRSKYKHPYYWGAFVLLGE